MEITSKDLGLDPIGMKEKGLDKESIDKVVDFVVFYQSLKDKEFIKPLLAKSLKCVFDD